MKKEICGVAVEIRKGKFRTLRIVVNRAGGVRMNVPLGISGSVAEAFFRSKFPWVERTLARIAKEREGRRAEVYLWGNPLRLVSRTKGEEGVSVSDGEFRVVASDEEKSEKLVDDFFRRETEREGKAALDRWAEITGLRYTVFRVRKTVSRWGSCNVKTGEIHLSRYLANLPPDALDYVALHEICHLRFANHGKDFRAMLALYMPDWKIRSGRLKENHYMRGSGFPSARRKGDS